MKKLMLAALAASLIVVSGGPAYSQQVSGGSGGGVLDRWKDGGGKGSGSGEEQEDKMKPRAHAGYRVLKLNQRVSYYKCQANPVSCQCPAGAQKVKFFETTSWGGVARNTLMCVPSCEPGKLLRRSRDVKNAGRVKFSCEDPVDYADLK